MAFNWILWQLGHKCQQCAVTQDVITVVFYWKFSNIYIFAKNINLAYENVASAAMCTRSISVNDKLFNIFDLNNLLGHKV